MHKCSRVKLFNSKLQLSRNVIDNHYGHKESSKITMKEVWFLFWSVVTTYGIVKRYNALCLTQESFSLSIYGKH